MKKNLNVSAYRNGDPIPQVTDPAQWRDLKTGAWCYNNNEPIQYGATYGKLYNWYAVNDPRGLAPQGWHIPSDSEWTTLITNLGGENIAGSKMKEAGNDHWQRPNTDATNSSGFTALPGGFHDSIEFLYVGFAGYWWSSTETINASSWYRILGVGGGLVSRRYDSKLNGLSVRCLKD